MIFSGIFCVFYKCLLLCGIAVCTEINNGILVIFGKNIKPARIEDKERVVVAPSPSRLRCFAECARVSHCSKCVRYNGDGAVEEVVKEERNGWHPHADDYVLKCDEILWNGGTSRRDMQLLRPHVTEEYPPTKQDINKSSPTKQDNKESQPLEQGVNKSPRSKTDINIFPPTTRDIDKFPAGKQDINKSSPAKSDVNKFPSRTPDLNKSPSSTKDIEKSTPNIHETGPSNKGHRIQGSVSRHTKVRKTTISTGIPIADMTSSLSEGGVASVEYKVVTETGTAEYSGTNAYVYLKLYGINDSDELYLNHPGAEMSLGKVDTFHFYKNKDLGMIRKMEIRMVGFLFINLPWFCVRLEVERQRQYANYVKVDVYSSPSRWYPREGHSSALPFETPQNTPFNLTKTYYKT